SGARGRGRGVAQTGAAVWAWRINRAPQWPDVNLLLSPQPAKYVHRKTHAADVSQHFRKGQGSFARDAVIQAMETGILYAFIPAFFWGTSPILVKRERVDSDVSAATLIQQAAILTLILFTL